MNWEGAPKNQSGRLGEQEAVRYLKKKGHRIIDTNHKICGVEFDIISVTGETLVFTEVKTRSSEDFGLPEDYVFEKQKRRLLRGAQAFITFHHYDDFLIRFDVISVLRQNDKFIIDHIEDAFDETF